jgi:hypothetical protein
MGKLQRIAHQKIDAAAGGIARNAIDLLQHRVVLNDEAGEQSLRRGLVLADNLARGLERAARLAHQFCSRAADAGPFLQGRDAVARGLQNVGGACEVTEQLVDAGGAVARWRG